MGGRPASSDVIPRRFENALSFRSRSRGRGISLCVEGHPGRKNQSKIPRSARNDNGSKFGRVGSGVIYETSALRAVVIPAKAGIHSANHRERPFRRAGFPPPASAEDKLRGNDPWYVREVVPNDTTAGMRNNSEYTPKYSTLEVVLCQER
jgi:hypothetical protein